MTKNKSRPNLLLIAGLLCLGVVQAQESTNSAGGNATGSEGNVSYSVGQVVYSTITDASGIVSQGVQQAYEIFTLGTKNQVINLSLSVFPNPAKENLTLQFNQYNNEKLSYQLFNMQGKLLITGELKNEQTTIDTISLPSGTYIINVTDQENNKIQSFKIIKY